MAGARGYHSYRGRGSTGKKVLAIVLGVILVAAGAFLLLQNRYVVYDENGNELKEWYALAAYLEQFGEDGLTARYADADSGSKHVSGSLAPGQLLTDWNWISWAVLGIVLLLLAGIVILFRFVCRRVRKRNRR